MIVAAPVTGFGHDLNAIHHFSRVLYRLNQSILEIQWLVLLQPLLAFEGLGFDA